MNGEVAWPEARVLGGWRYRSWERVLGSLKSLECPGQDQARPQAPSPPLCGAQPWARAGEQLGRVPASRRGPAQARCCPWTPGRVGWLGRMSDLPAFSSNLPGSLHLWPASAFPEGSAGEAELWSVMGTEKGVRVAGHRCRLPRSAVNVYLAVPGLGCSRGIMFPPGGWNRAPCVGSVESWPLDHQGGPGASPESRSSVLGMHTCSFLLPAHL